MLTKLLKPLLVCKSVTRTVSSCFGKSVLRLEPIGQLQPCHDHVYEPGQLVIHRLFGYRGVILNSWTANIFDKTIITDNNLDECSSQKLESGSPINLYTVLMDSVDGELCSPSLKSGITFLPGDKSIINTIYIVNDMDYALHEDIIPYISKDPVPLKNEYFQQFMHFDPDREPYYFPTDTLRQWLEERLQSLEVHTVHRETTEGIRTTAIPFLMGKRKFRYSEETFNRYWRYLIRVENLTDECVQLRERFWKVFSAGGSLESVNGKGVVGVQPFLTPQCPAFQYHSHVQVPVSLAHMWGSFRFERSSGATIDIKIPAFPLCDKDPNQNTTTTTTPAQPLE